MPEVRLRVEDTVGIITIDNPEARNGLNPELSAELIAACDEIDAQPEIGSAVIVGANRTFCSGADTREWRKDIEWAGDGYELLSSIYQGFKRVGELCVPTVAAVRGAAVGAGMNLMLACDLRIVAKDVRLVAGFLDIGLHPGGGFFTLLSRAGGHQATSAMGIFGEEVNGSRAAEIGLAWESTDDELVESRALELAKAGSKDPGLARSAVASFRRELGPPSVSWDAAIEIERGRQLWSMHRRFNS